jgi:16S rRNA (adenine1518-N6/adenine1519-N6)-dimethyltransferase
MRSIELIKKYGITLKKPLGQNLLLDPNINRKMVDVADVASEDAVVEVGAGIGDLTEVLAARAGAVLTVEIDFSFEAPLRERFEQNPRVRLFMGDILNHSVKELVDEYLPGARRLKMVSNLPYYITSPVLMHFLEDETAFVSLTVMVQKEVAERIVSDPGRREYGLLSVMCQFYAHPFIAHVVSPNCFRPRPQVDSAIVHFPMRNDIALAAAEREIFLDIVHAAFGQRRKKIINALAPLCSSVLPGKEDMRDLLRQEGILPDSRAETITVERYAQLAQSIARNRFQSA